MMDSSESSYIDYSKYFHGAVPPRAIFESETHWLDRIISTFDTCPEGDVRVQKVSEVCLIGLASYFEAFCKEQFAANINICPRILENFLIRRGDVTVKLKDILKISGMLDYRVGSLLAEEYDFGSAKTINGLYFDLLNITPFSKDEAEDYADFLQDRNLLVHHGGIYTLKYKKRMAQAMGLDRVFMDSLVIGKDEYQKWLTFLRELAKKMALASHKALLDFVQKNDVELSGDASMAIESLLWE
jgi:hypothetical protein